MKKIIYPFIFLIFSFFYSDAQPPPPPPPTPLSGADVPIDNEALIFFFTALIYGAWKIKSNKKFQIP